MEILAAAVVCLLVWGLVATPLQAAEPSLRARVLLDFGRLLPPAWEGAAVSLAREIYALGYRAESAGPYEVRVLKDQYFDVRRALQLDIYLPDPPPAEALPAVIVVHGGGWKYFSKAAVSGIAEVLASQGFVAIAPNYRLSGEAKWPAQIDDLRRALQWVRRHAPALGVDPEGIAALGDSAGGHLAAMLGTTEAGLATVVAYYGVYDMVPLIGVGEGTVDNPIDELLPDHSEEACRQASPLYQVRSDNPPFLLIHGKADSVVPLQQTEEFAARLQAEGVPVQTLYISGADHMLLGLPGPIDPPLPVVDQQVLAFLRLQLGQSTGDDKTP